MTPTVKTLVNQPYKYGFVTNIESDTIPRGLNEDVIRLISAKKNEPQFMLDFRLKAYRKWLTMQEPVWADLNFPAINYQDIIYYSAPKVQAKKQSLDEVDPTLLEAFEKLGIPLSEQKRLSNVAVDAVFDSVSIATTYKENLAKEGVIFCSISEAVVEHPELIEKYLGSVVPVGDNFFAALNSAVFSDGSFVYVPKGVKCPMDLSTYFRINNGDSGQFERTLIITDEGASVTYLEGCHPAGEQILTLTGWTNIEAIKPGDLVYDHNGDPQKVRASMVRQFKGDMITIRPMSRFNEFRLTPEHPVYAIKRQDVLVKRKQRKDHWLPEVDTKKLLKAEPQWIKADELQKGDFVLVPKLHHPAMSYADDLNNWVIGNDLPQIHYQARRLNLNVSTEQAQVKINGSVAVQEKPQQLLILSEQSDRTINRQPLYQVGYTPEKKWDAVRETETHFIVPIKEIERQAYDDLVFNIDVDNTHSYLARGVAVHNCTAPMFDTNQLHAAVVELVALDNAEIKYSTVQNWYAGDENGKGGIYNFVTKRGICKGINSKISWTQVETGSAITWKYPSCVLVGDNSVGEFYSVALTNNKQQADTGTKMVHIGNNTRSTIISKGISAGNSANSYRGLVKVNPKAVGARNYSQCDSMLIGDRAQANTFPYIQVENSTAKVEHEASTSKIGEDQLFYFAQRGISAEDAVSMIISGFCRDVFNKLPMEFAAEADKLLSLKLEGTVG